MLVVVFKRGLYLLTRVVSSESVVKPFTHANYLYMWNIGLTTIWRKRIAILMLCRNNILISNNRMNRRLRNWEKSKVLDATMGRFNTTQRHAEICERRKKIVKFGIFRGVAAESISQSFPSTDYPNSVPICPKEHAAQLTKEMVRKRF